MAAFKISVVQLPATKTGHAATKFADQELKSPMMNLVLKHRGGPDAVRTGSLTTPHGMQKPQINSLPPPCRLPSDPVL